MSDHKWCRDVSRDEAVRAAEDAAAVPAIQHRDLPEQVALLWASLGDLIGRVVRLEGEFDAGQDEEASPAVCDSASPAEGLRTERVTLEVRWNPDGEPWSRVAEWLPAALLSEWFGAPGESVRVVDEADAASDEAVANGATLSALADARESLAAANRGIARLTAERDAAIRERDEAQSQCEELERAALVDHETIGTLLARVAELESAAKAAPAANAGGEDNSEPVAWGVLMTPGSKVWRCSSEKQAQKCVDHFGTGTVVPLYAAPQPPRGWLTAEERKAVDAARDYFDDDNHGDSECVFIARMLKQLLARSSPPRVRRPNPNVVITTVDARERIDRQWIAAIRAAGGEVEE